MTRDELQANANRLEELRSETRIMRHRALDARSDHRTRLLEALELADWGLHRSASTMHQLIREMDSASQASAQ
jgi:hypothetical protein